MDYKYLAGRSPLFSHFPPHIGISARRQGLAACLAACEAPLQAPESAVVGDSLREPAAASGRANGEKSGSPPPSSGSPGRGALDSGGDPGRPPCAIGSQPRAPFELHSAFDPNDVEVWDEGRFEMIKKLMDATRNKGQVYLMRDTQDGRLFALKMMPNTWMKRSHQEFIAEHPHETELPWQDLGILTFLDRVKFPYMCPLQGVYRDDNNTYVRTMFATEGDLFKWCEGGPGPGPEREALIRPLAVQLLKGMQRLHEMSMVHRDISLENILLSKNEGDGTLAIKIIDLSMASTTRWFRNTVRGKASYQAPELHEVAEYDAYLSDAFAIGVTIYALLLKDYPWLATRPGGCKCFEYVKKKGLRAYLVKRKVRESTTTVDQVISEPMKQLLEGLLAFDPNQRLTLGECNAGWEDGAAECKRRSVWDEPWLHADGALPEPTLA